MAKPDLSEIYSPKILIVEDDLHIMQLLRSYFDREYFQVISATNGAEGLELARSEAPDIVVLDLMLPELDGRELCRRLRLSSDVPVLMLTARVEEHDRLKGLELGADDYVTKPFSPSEVVARVKAILRRAMPQPAPGADGAPPPQKVGDVTLAAERRDAKAGADWLGLTPTEFNLLSALARTAGAPLARPSLMSAISKDGEGAVADNHNRVLDVHISNLRQKLHPAKRVVIKSVYGVGYMLSVAAE